MQFAISDMYAFILVGGIPTAIKTEAISYEETVNNSTTLNFKMNANTAFNGFNFRVNIDPLFVEKEGDNIKYEIGDLPLSKWQISIQDYTDNIFISCLLKDQSVPEPRGDKSILKLKLSVIEEDGKITFYIEKVA
jgi:hypothetical protein